MLSWLRSGSSDPKQYSVEVDAPEKPGEGKPRRHFVVRDRPLVDTINPAVTTLYENFLYGCKLAGDGPFLGKRSVVGSVAGPYVFSSYNECYERAKNIGAGLVGRGLSAKKPIALYSVNRAEWVLAEQGSFMFNLTTVPLYDTLGEEAIKHIINQTQLTTVICSKDKIGNLLHLKKDLPTLKLIVSMDALDDVILQTADEAGVEIVAYEAVEAEGLKNPRKFQLPTPNDIATICYTSGTTGLPKGVVLTHRNLLSVSQAYLFAVQNNAGAVVLKEDVHISYLPLAHVFERALMSMFIGAGARIGFYQGDTLKLLEDIAELRPTIFASVPRLFNRIFDKVWASAKAKGGISEMLFSYAYNSKKYYLGGGTVHHYLWEYIIFAYVYCVPASIPLAVYSMLVFGKVRERLGGRVRLMITGSAPLSSEVMAFLRVAFSCDVLEGYGQTETSAGALITVLGDTSLGNVGAPFPCNEVKLVDVPEMNYTSKDTPFPRGEVCFRGFNCFREYYKMPDKTAEAVDADGWVHSGDIGMWDAQGRLKIVDRKKNIFKLAQGEYIAPEKIENVYANHELVAQAFVYGDSLQATLVAIVVPDEQPLLTWAAQSGLGGKSLVELCKMESVQRHLLQSLQDHGRSSGLLGFENVKSIFLASTPFSVENDLLTPTFKLKRFEAKQKYQKQIDALYGELTPTE